MRFAHSELLPHYQILFNWTSWKRTYLLDYELQCLLKKTRIKCQRNMPGQEKSNQPNSLRWRWTFTMCYGQFLWLIRITAFIDSLQVVYNSRFCVQFLVLILLWRWSLQKCAKIHRSLWRLCFRSAVWEVSIQIRWIGLPYKS